MRIFGIFLIGLVTGGTLYALSNIWAAYETPYVDKPLKVVNVAIGPLIESDSWLREAKADLIPIEHPENHRALALLRLQIPVKQLRPTTLNLIGYRREGGGGEVKPVIIDLSVLNEQSDCVWLLLDFGPKITWGFNHLRLESCT